MEIGKGCFDCCSCDDTEQSTQIWNVRSGQQIRRSSKSVRSAIVEGYGRRTYRQDYIRFLTIALSSNDETMDHLDTLIETGSLQNRSLYDDLKDKIDHLGRKLTLFIRSVAKLNEQIKIEEKSSEHRANE